MASLRRQILDALATRFGAVSGWTAYVRSAIDVNNPPTDKVAYLYDRTEELRTDTHLYYDAELDVVVVIRVRVEDAGAANAYDYADAALVELQKVIHSGDNRLGLPSVSQVLQISHSPQPPDERNTVGVEWRLRIDYRHDYQDPEQWTGTF